MEMAARLAATTRNDSNEAVSTSGLEGCFVFASLLAGFILFGK